MSSFASRDNIDMIWQVISTFPLLNKLYPSEFSKLRWFNSIVSSYQTTFVDNINDLHLVNRSVITAMMNDLQKKSSYAVDNTNVTITPRIDNFSDKIDEPIKNMSELIQKHIDEREMPFDNPVPKDKSYAVDNTNVTITPRIDNFSDKIDEPIKNMSELIQKHIDERDMPFDNLVLKDTPVGDFLSKDPIETNYSDYPYHDLFEGVSPLQYTGKKKAAQSLSLNQISANIISLGQKVDHIIRLVDNFTYERNSHRYRRSNSI